MSGGRWIAQYPGGGVRISLNEEQHRHEVQVSLSELRRHVDERIVANLCRAFAGCDRLTSLAHLSLLNGTLPEGSLARARNVMTITTYLFGTMRETAKALSDLRGAGIEGALQDTAPWIRLDEIRRRWVANASIRWRDRIAFHLCYSTKDAIKGLDVLQDRSDRVTFSEIETPSDNAKLLDIRYPIGDEVLFAAADLDDDEIKAVVSGAPRDSAQMTLALQEIMRDLLRQCGAKV